MNTANSGEDIYERLANALEALPGGFARTESGVEMELLKMAFSPEEAWLAGQMTRTPETPAEIAKRVGLPVEEVTLLLNRMIPRRMVRVATQGMVASPAELEGDDVKYRLGHFLVGWYEGNERILGRDYDILFERYVVEGGGDRIFSPGRATRVWFLTGARSNPSGWRGSPTSISTLTGNGMSVFWS